MKTNSHLLFFQHLFQNQKVSACFLKALFLLWFNQLYRCFKIAFHTGISLNLNHFMKGFIQTF